MPTSGNRPPRPGPGGLNGGGGVAFDDPPTAGGDVPLYRASDSLRTREYPAYAAEPDVLHRDPATPRPASQFMRTPVVDPVVPTPPVMDPIAGLHAATTHPLPEMRTHTRPPGVFVDDTLADPDIGPSIRPVPFGTAFGVRIRATSVGPLRSAHTHQPPPYPADTGLPRSAVASGLDGRTNLPRQESVRFADQERLRRLRQNGKLRAGDDVGEGALEGDI